MPSTYSNLKIELIATGEQSGTWGTTTNTNLGTAIEEAITGSADVTFVAGLDTTITLTDTNAAQAARNLRLNLIGTSNNAQNLILGSGCQIEKLYLINNTLGHTITVKNTTGTGIAVPAGKKMVVYNDGTNVVNAVDYFSSLNVEITGGTINNTVIGGSTPAAGTFTQVNIPAQGDLRLEDTTGGQYVAIQAPGTVASSYTLTLPVDDGTNGQALITDGSGNLSWSTAASGDVYVPASATDNAIARFDLTTGKLIQNSSALVDDSGNVLAGAGTVSVPAFSTTGDTNTGIFFPAADTIAFTEGGVESGRFTSTGALQLNNNLTFSGTGNRITGDFSTTTDVNKVGFQTSTTNGATVLTVIPNGTGTSAGMYFFNSSGVTNSARFDIGLLSGGTEARLSSTIIGSGSYVPMTFLTGGSERLRIDTSGNVGIGTSSPGAKLDVQTGSNARLRISESGTTLYQDSLSAAASAWTPAIYRATEFKWNNGSSDRMTIDSSGNVGIGTSSPVSISGYTIQTINNSNTGGGVYLQSNGTTIGRILNTATDMFVGGVSVSSALILQAGSAERMRITSGGDLLVGLTGSGGRLSIRGETSDTTKYTLFTEAQDGTDQLAVRCDGAVYMGLDGGSPYNLTTATAANATLLSDGFFYRSTSSLKYKKDVQDATHGLAEVLQLRPVTYKGKSEADGDKVFGGLIAEEVDAIGLTEFVQYAEDGSPDALAYGNMVSLLAKAVQELKAIVDAQAERIAILESK